MSGSSEGRTEQGHFLSQKVFPVALKCSPFTHDFLSLQSLEMGVRTMFSRISASDKGNHSSSTDLPLLLSEGHI